MSFNIRKFSFNVLFDVFFNKEKLNVVLDKIVDDNGVIAEDLAFLKRETTGVIEKVDALDEVINLFSKVKTNKLNKDILIVLRIGIYEMMYMDKVPVFATINECVNMVKHSKSAKLSGYVNAVLRSVSRDASICKKENTKIDKENFNINDNRNCYFRIYNDHEKIVLDELKSKNVAYSPYVGALDYKYAKVYKVNKYKDIIDTDSFRNGDVLIEDASSIYLTDKLAYYIKERERKIKEKSKEGTISMMKLLDTCASPGGKILGLIDLIYSDYFYFYAEARDISEEKILKICENVNRLKVLDLNMNVKDATKYDVLDNDKFDVVICDVPCTGLGVINKKPDIKLNYSDEKRDSLVKIQREILDVSSKYLKKGGILSYSTCTETKEENEDNIKDFLTNNSDFEMIFEKKISLNDENNADGFYMCFMTKK